MSLLTAERLYRLLPEFHRLRDAEEGEPLRALLGLIEALTAGYLSSQYKDAAAFVVILLVLFFMPQGLFGAKSTERV